MTTEQKVENWGTKPVVLCIACGKPIKAADAKQSSGPASLKLSAHKDC